MARRFLAKAEHDLITARQTLLVVDGPTDTVCFHAQEAAEKAIKGLLPFFQVTFPKTHDLVRLLDISLPHFPELTQYREELAALSEFAVEIRYPDDWFEPSRDDAIRALSIAEEVVARIRNKSYPC
jgi:HEPN domain-containing protein